jgi:hypothetical protein
MVRRTLSQDEKKLADLNKRGFGDWILSMDHTKVHGRVAFVIVKNAKTKGLPGGDLLLAFTRLKTKFEPGNTPQLMKLTKEFHSKTLAKNQDPDIFITELEALCMKLAELDHENTNQALIIHILNNLNKNYNTEMKLLEHRIHLYKEDGKGKKS